MGPVEPAILILMDCDPPVGQLWLAVNKAQKSWDWYGKSHDGLNCFNIFLARLIVIDFVHAENDAALGGEGRRYLLTIDYPVAARHSLLYKKSISAFKTLPDQQLLFTEPTWLKGCVELVPSSFIIDTTFCEPISYVWELLRIHTSTKLEKF